MDINEILKKIVKKQWKGFEASWLKNEQTQNYGNTIALTPTQQRNAKTTKLWEDIDKALDAYDSRAEQGY